MLVCYSSLGRNASTRNREVRPSYGNLACGILLTLSIMAGFSLLAFGSGKQQTMMDDLRGSERTNGWHVLVSAEGIYYLDLAHSALKAIYVPPGGSAVSFVGMASLNPDGSRIAFSESVGLRSYSLTMLDVQTGQRMALLELPYLMSPRWSPDGASIAFEGTKTHRAGASSLFLYKVGVAEPSRIVDANIQSGDFLLSWSPDGSRIVYQNAADKVCIVEVGSKASTVIGPGRFPSWSPDGKYISYQVDDGEYCLYDLQTRQSTSILKGESVQRTLVWSPDSRYVVYSRLSGGLRSHIAGILSTSDTYGDLYVMDIRSKTEARVYRHDGSLYPTAWGKIQMNQ